MNLKRRDAFSFNLFGVILSALGQTQNSKKAFSKGSKLQKNDSHTNAKNNVYYGGLYNRALAYVDDDPEKTKLVFN